MITKEQQEWLDHLNDDDKIIIVPWDSTAEDKFRDIKQNIQQLLGDYYRIEHRGASSLKISGQDEIDIYIPVSGERFDETVEKVAELYGNPRSNYHLKRARFTTLLQGKHIDIFVINEEDAGWVDSEIFHNYLLSNAEVLKEYCNLKERLQGKSTKIYYTAKTEFINEILFRAKK